MNGKVNFMDETINFLRDHGINAEDVLYVTDGVNKCDFGDFLEHSSFEYSSGFGSHAINLRLKIVGKDWWAERAEYDGSEWWELKKHPGNGDNLVNNKINIKE